MLTYVLLYGVAGLFVCAVIAATVAIERRKKRAAEQSRAPNSRAELARWLGEQIEAITALRRAVEDEARKAVPNADRCQQAQDSFWYLHSQVALRVEVAAPEFSEYWREQPDWFPAHVRAAPEHMAELGRYFGWKIERLQYIKARLP